MMKKIIFTAVLVFHFSFSVSAARYSAGVEAWYVFWDSAISGVVEDGIDSYVKAEIDQVVADNSAVSGHTISADKKIGNGLMMGPSFTFETDDRKWSASVKGMFSVYIGQKMNFPGSLTYDTGHLIGTVNVPLNVSSDITLSRYEVMAEGRRRFLEYFTVFAGYLYMYYNIDAKFTGGASYSGINLYSLSRRAEVTSHIHFPLLGLGAEYPVMKELKLGLDIASGYMFADAEAVFEGSKGNIDIEPQFGFMTTLKADWSLSETIVLSFGYRFQYLAFDMTSDLDLNGDTSVPDKTSKNETFHGITLGCRYNF